MRYQLCSLTSLIGHHQDRGRWSQSFRVEHLYRSQILGISFKMMNLVALEKQKTEEGTGFNDKFWRVEKSLSYSLGELLLWSISLVMIHFRCEDLAVFQAGIILSGEVSWPECPWILSCCGAETCSKNLCYFRMEL